MLNAISKQESSNTPWTQEQIQLITNTVAKGATPDELKLFLYTASRTGLDPLTKQIHFVKRKTKKYNSEIRDYEFIEQMTIQTGIDGYRAIAERSGTLAGIDDAVYDTEDTINPNKATVTVYRIINSERVPFTASARWSEYAQVYEKDEYVDGRKTGKKITKTGPMWEKMPYLMLAKCAEALALRKALPNDLSGLYTNEEMQQADNTVSTEYTPPRAPETTTEPHESDMAVEGEVVEKPIASNDNPKKQCPLCQTWHTGRYPKCFNCWKSGNTVQTKKIVNPSAAPFV